MANLYTKVKLYLKANSKTVSEFEENIKLRNDSDGNGDYIHIWSVSGLAKPTDEQLETYNSAVTTEINNQNIILTRKSLYGSWDKQLEEINEQGIDSWKARLAQIKLDNPKE
jgi:hypothetical protein